MLYSKDGQKIAHWNNNNNQWDKYSNVPDDVTIPGDLEINRQVAELNSQLGKEQSKNKALHQKEQEQKEKK